MKHSCCQSCQTLKVSFLRMVPTRFNFRFTVGAGNGPVRRNRPTTFDESSTQPVLSRRYFIPRSMHFWPDFGQMTRGHNSGPDIKLSGRRGHTQARTRLGFSRACCYLAALSGDLLVDAPRGEVMLAGLVADKRVAAHTLKGRKETGRERCVWVSVRLGPRVPI